MCDVKDEIRSDTGVLMSHVRMNEGLASCICWQAAAQEYAMSMVRENHHLLLRYETCQLNNSNNIQPQVKYCKEAICICTYGFASPLVDELTSQ